MRLHPQFIPPCLPTYTAEVPTGPAWAYEIKHDGYRFIVHKDGEEVLAFTRGGHDWAEKVPAIVEAVRGLDAKSATIDGECVVAGQDGVTDFDAVRSALGRKRTYDAFLYAFDLLEMNGDDLRRTAWEQRRDQLARLLKNSAHGIQLSEHADDDGEALFRHACRMGLEGLVAKRRKSIYRSGRTRDWLKIKNPLAPAFARVREAFALR